VGGWIVGIPRLRASMNRYRDPTQAAPVIVIISTVDSGIAKSS